MRNWDDVSKVAYKAAHRAVVSGFEVDDLVGEAYATMRWQRCEDHELYKTLKNDMVNAINRQIGQKGRPKRDGELNSVSIDHAYGDDPSQFSYEDKGLLELENKELSKKLLNSLNPMQQKVISDCIYKERTFQSIADELGISKSQATRIYHKAISQLRESDLIKDLQ